MPQLTTPDTRARASFMRAMAEFRAEGRGDPTDDSMLGADIRRHHPAWSDFDGYVAALVADAREETPRPADHVPATTYWYVDGQAYLGRIVVRHRLTPDLLERGGHVGYDVRPSARRRGHATAMLNGVLPLAARLGIARALVTCDVDNVASRTVIERCGGVLEDERAGKLRFWIVLNRPVA